MLTFKIIKTQGSGNDFVLIDIINFNQNISIKLKQEIAMQLCNRQSGLGADGVLFVEQSLVADAKMRIFNADGSEAIMCGNGLRIVGRWVAEKKNKREILIENFSRIIYSINIIDDFFSGVNATQIMFPPASFFTKTLPINVDTNTFINKQILDFSTKLFFTAISTPNPHVISLVEHIDEVVLSNIGQQMNAKNNVFPKGVNVSMAKKIDNNTLYVSTYERGVGLTNSCGTAMFASVVMATKIAQLQANNFINVYNNGGFIKIKLNNDYSGIMIGNASYVYGGELIWNNNEFDFNQTENYVEEQKAYENLLQSMPSFAL